LGDPGGTGRAAEPAARPRPCARSRVDVHWLGLQVNKYYDLATSFYEYGKLNLWGLTYRSCMVFLVRLRAAAVEGAPRS
jgi:hypothetical protein